jgi:hypothetical protein
MLEKLRYMVEYLWHILTVQKSVCNGKQSNLIYCQDRQSDVSPLVVPGAFIQVDMDDEDSM